MMYSSSRFVVLGVLLVGLLAGSAYADMSVNIYVGDQHMSMQPGPRVRNGVTYGPLRAAAEAIGATVEWDAATRTATICRDGQRVPIKQSQGITVGGSVMIPVRLMSEALGRSVTWDSSARAVRIHGEQSGGAPGFQGQQPGSSQQPGPQQGQRPGQQTGSPQQPGAQQGQRPGQQPGQQQPPGPPQ